MIKQICATVLEIFIILAQIISRFITHLAIKKAQVPTNITKAIILIKIQLQRIKLIILS